ncbi:hypothetical protein F5B21DRAFT_473647 [Xylaria acuta]|nr:hypothetical protein F5B21DRAFT_473647 [Xylaria acuta]
MNLFKFTLCGVYIAVFSSFPSPFCVTGYFKEVSKVFVVGTFLVCLAADDLGAKRWVDMRRLILRELEYLVENILILLRAHCW